MKPSSPGMLGSMDPAVVAALVASPTALIAASAAYAAGRLQAHGAHRGPVDAVRRQHQRDAYAVFLGAANAFAEASRWRSCRSQALREISEAEGGDSRDLLLSDNERVDRAALEIRLRAGRLLLELKPARDVISLEGPAHVADLADEVHGAASSLIRESFETSLVTTFTWTPEPGYSTDVKHDDLREAIAAFTTAARDYLNGERSR